MTIAELFARPDTWCQDELARTSDGTPCSPLSSEACRWCLIGSLYHCYTTSQERKDIRCKLFHKFGTEEWSLWNDQTDRTQDEVLALAQELGI